MFPFSSNKIFLFEFSFSYYFSFFCSLVNTHFLESTENKLKNLFSVTKRNKENMSYWRNQLKLISDRFSNLLDLKKNIWFYFSGSVINHIFIIFIGICTDKRTWMSRRDIIFIREDLFIFIWICYSFCGK